MFNDAKPVLGKLRENSFLVMPSRLWRRSHSMVRVLWSAVLIFAWAGFSSYYQ